MHREQWQFTVLGKLHQQLEEVLHLATHERVMVSCFIAQASWYVFTTRRVVSGRGVQVEELLSEGLVGEQFGNFKRVGHAGVGTFPLETATLKNEATGQELKIEFEASHASMAPIYACKFWVRRSLQAASAAKARAESERSDGSTP
jgi:hypothetical protein